MKTAPLNEESGYKYGRWTVVRYAGHSSSGKDRLLECECECGEKRTVRKCILLNGDSRSCGCMKNEKARARRIALGAPLAVAAANNHYRSYKINSSRRGFSFDMSMEEFQYVTSLQCHYCSASAKEHQITRKTGRSGPRYKVMSGYFANGLDRIDSSVGYRSDNVLPCCFVCNSSKSNMSYGDFLKMCNRVAIVHPAKSEVDNG